MAAGGGGGGGGGSVADGYQEVVSCKNNNDADCERSIKESGVDMIVLGDCRIIKDPIIAASLGGIVNVHPGYLPDVKGNNPYIEE